MTVQTQTLADFLLARIAEDEALAREASAGLDLNWCDFGINPELLIDARFLERYASPARVLAECESKRRIVELHGDYGKSWPGVDHSCTECGAAGEFPVEWPCTTLRLLALPYASHPEYRSEWAS